MIGDPENDLLVLLGKLIEKIRRGLSANISPKANSDCGLGMTNSFKAALPGMRLKTAAYLFSLSMAERSLGTSSATS
jgi:hypothetical protein